MAEHGALIALVLGAMHRSLGGISCVADGRTRKHLVFK